ncbi:hypothetical protein BGZ76_001128 [Entomortierella beljakovae]|nr:hypothetical protein BGZ76_001128 [Entomortierella beljakovae]
MSYAMRRKNLVSELNLMVAGFSGLGKTSFIRTLYGTLKLRSSGPGLKNKLSNANIQDVAPMSPTAGGGGMKPHGTKESVAYATGELDRTLNSFEALFEIDEGNEKINLTLVDTPGFVGTDEIIDAHCEEILHYLEYQFDLTLAEERKVRRNPKAVDNQIHACLYFIDHTGPRLGLSDADIRVLKRLGTRVNIIPVIARGDSLTRSQSKRMKQAVIKDAIQHEINFFQFLSPKLAKKLQQQNEEEERRTSRAGPEDEEDEDEDEDDEDEDDWDPDYLEEKAHLQSLLPFTVIAQEEGVDINDQDGKPIQGREFPWGILNCLDSNHCDLDSLRSALLSSHRQELKEITFGFFYEKYRTEKLLARTKSQHIALEMQQQLKNGRAAQQPLKGKESMLSVGSSGAIAGPWEE